MIILYSISVFAGRIGEGGTLGSTHRIRKGYQPPRVTLQQQQGTIGPARTRHRPEGACRVRVVLASRSPFADGPDTTAQNPTRPRRMAELGQSEPGQEEEAAGC